MSDLDASLDYILCSQDQDVSSSPLQLSLVCLVYISTLHFISRTVLQHGVMIQTAFYFFSTTDDANVLLNGLQ